MKEKFIIRNMKQMLQERRSHVIMRTVIHLLEQSESTSPEKPISLSHNDGIFQSHFEDVGEKEYMDDLKSLATFSSTYMNSSLIQQDKYSEVYELKSDQHRCYFKIPKRFGRKKIVNTNDILEKNIQDVWNYWLENIGSIKTIYKRSPTLTKSKKGRYHCIKSALVFASPCELKMAIEGCLRSPYHMGYKIDFREFKVSLARPYCDVQTILRSREQVEKMMLRANDALYSIQVEDTKAKFKIRNIDHTAFGLPEKNNDIEISLAPEAYREPSDDDFEAWLAT